MQAKKSCVFVVVLEGVRHPPIAGVDAEGLRTDSSSALLCFMASLEVVKNVLFPGDGPLYCCVESGNSGYQLAFLATHFSYASFFVTKERF